MNTKKEALERQFIGLSKQYDSIEGIEKARKHFEESFMENRSKGDPKVEYTTKHLKRCIKAANSTLNKTNKDYNCEYIKRENMKLRLQNKLEQRNNN